MEQTDDLTIRAIHAMEAQDPAKRIAWEKATVVTPHGETIFELRAVFETVCNKNHWKNAWAALVPVGLVGITMRAVEFFHADNPMTCKSGLKGIVVMWGKGYQAD